MAMEQPKTIIVTGGASGIGYAFCEHLGQLGHQIVIADLRALRRPQRGYAAAERRQSASRPTWSTRKRWRP